MKKFITTLLISSLLLGLVGCAGGAEKQEAAQASDTNAQVQEESQTYSLKVSTVLTDTDPIVLGLQKMAEDVSKETEGNVNIEVYPSSQLGDTADVLEQAKSGSNVGVIIDTGMLADYVPDMAIYTGPYVFDSVENARKFIDTDIFKAWDEELATHGLRDLGCNWYQGARNFWTSKKVETPDDLNSMRVRTMGSQVAQETMKSLGATPTSLAWSEAYSGLQGQVVDSVEAQTTAVYGSSLFEVTKYCAQTEHFLLYTGLVISEKWYESLPDDYKEIVMKNAVAAGDYATELTLENEKIYNDEMKESGIEFVEVDKELFKNASASVYETMGWTELKAKIDEALGQ